MAGRQTKAGVGSMSLVQGDELSDESVPEEFCDPITLMLMVPSRPSSLTTCASCRFAHLLTTGAYVGGGDDGLGLRPQLLQRFHHHLAAPEPPSVSRVQALAHRGAAGAQLRPALSH